MEHEVTSSFNQNGNRNRSQRAISLEGFEFIQLKDPLQLFSLKSEPKLMEVTACDCHFFCEPLHRVPAASEYSGSLAHGDFGVHQRE